MYMETYNHVLFFKLLHMRKGINIDIDMPLDGSSPLLVLAFLLNSALGPLRSKFTHSCTSSISNSFGAAETLTPCRFADITDSEYRAMLGYRRMGWTPSSSAIMRRLVSGSLGLGSSLGAGTGSTRSLWCFTRHYKVLY